VLAIAGNHDSAERLDYAAGLLSNQQVYLAGQFTSAPRRVILQDEFGELTFDLLPFVRPATVRHCLPDADIRDEDSAIAAALGPLPTAGERRVLIAHQMVLGGGSLPTCSPAARRCHGCRQWPAPGCSDEQARSKTSPAAKLRRQGAGRYRKYPRPAPPPAHCGQCTGQGPALRYSAGPAAGQSH